MRQKGKGKGLDARIKRKDHFIILFTAKPQRCGYTRVFSSNYSLIPERARMGMGEKIAIADHKQQAISTEGRHMPKAFSSPTPVEIAFKKKKRDCDGSDPLL